MTLITQTAMLASPPNHLADHTPLMQVGALCWRIGTRGPEVLLVKSSHGRWILPKGWPMDNKTDAEAAQIEAWEEAGVKRGLVSKAPINSFASQKRFNSGKVKPCHIAVYSIAVEKMVSSYPECRTRRRKWMRVKKAIKKVDEAGLQEILRHFSYKRNSKFS